MSISIAIINKDISVVASDSQVYENATYHQNGQINKPSSIIEGRFYKIFHHHKTGILGAMTGMMSLDGYSTPQAILKILDRFEPAFEGSDLKTATRFVTDEVLRLVKAKNVPIQSKVLDLILVSREFLSKGDFEFYYIRFQPDSNGTVGWRQQDYRTMKEFPDDPDTFIFMTIGINPAQEAVHAYFKATPPRNEDKVTYYTKLAHTIILEGVSHCGSHPENPDIPACGGEPNIFYIQ